MSRQLATGRQAVSCLIALGIWMLITAMFVGLRPEHVVLAVLLLVMFLFTRPSRKLALALLPFIIFGISYDWMNIVPNYTVRPVDTAGLYHTELSLFGINTATATGVLTPNEFCALHRSAVADLLAGVFYLCWVPLPVFFGLWLYFSGKRTPYLHFALVFLLVNLIGFTFYYIHPAAPPWYVAMHGFEAVPGTPGSVAGLEGFGRITGWNVFEGLYARNSNVFAAMPSLHSAYTLVAFIYAVRSKSSLAWRWILGIVTVGIWCTAVYSSHHYVLDVLAGIGCALVGFALFEFVLMHLARFRRFVARYSASI